MPSLNSRRGSSEGSRGTPYTIRIRVPEGVTYKFNDLVRGEVSFESKDIGDWVLVKANGIPTYNYAVVLDDHFMDITHVFRGEEHLSNTPKQMMIFDAFNWEYPQYGHMTLIVNEERKNYQNVMSQSSSSLHNTRNLAIYQKPCLTSLHCSAGLLKVKKKSSLRKSLSNCLMKNDYLNHHLCLIKQSLHG